MPTRDEKNVFSTLILTRADSLRTDCLDAMVSYCEEVGIEMEVAALLVNDVLKARLEEQYQELRYLPRSGKLPI